MARHLTNSRAVSVRRVILTELLRTEKAGKPLTFGNVVKAYKVVERKNLTVEEIENALRSLVRSKKLKRFEDGHYGTTSKGREALAEEKKSLMKTWGYTSGLLRLLDRALMDRIG